MYHMTDKTTRKKILSYLYDIYKKNPSTIAGTDEIAKALDIPFVEAKGELIYLHQKEFVDSFVDGDSNWAQKINADGIDELERLETETPVDVNYSLDVKTSKLHDFFICHATEDKEIVARPLAEKLDELGLDVWYDEFSLRWGSKLMKTIGKGINESRFGIVIFSPNFFEKKWTQMELDGLIQKLNLDNGELLPLLYNMTHDELKHRLSLLSGILCRSWDEGLEKLVEELVGIATGKSDKFRKNRVAKPELNDNHESKNNSISQNMPKVISQHDYNLTTIIVGKEPRFVTLNSLKNIIYVSNHDSNTVSVIDGNTNKVIDTVEVGTWPAGIDINKKINKIYVANSHDNTISVIDADTNDVVKTVLVGKGPFAVVVDPVFNRIYVTNQYDNSVSVIDGKTNTVISLIPVGYCPVGIGVNPTTNKIYVANYDSKSNSIAVIDGKTNSIDMIKIEATPFGIGINVQKNEIYATIAFGTGANIVSIIDGKTNTVTLKISVGSQPNGIAVNDKTNKIYVSNLDGTLSVITR